jgi:hypothetical protein
MTSPPIVLQPTITTTGVSTTSTKNDFYVENNVFTITTPLPVPKNILHILHLSRTKDLSQELRYLPHLSDMLDCSLCLHAELLFTAVIIGPLN